MAWTWTMQTAAGDPAASELAPAEGFPSRADAESWVGEVWADLLSDGVEQVVLMEEGREVYGPMSLRPA